MKQIATMLALALPIMGATCQDQLRSVLTQTCDGLAVAYAHYDAVAESGVVSAFNMARVAAVRQQSDYLCANPASATTVSVTAVAAKAYVALNAAFKQGGSLSDAKAGYSKVQDLKGLLDKARRM